MRSLALPVDIKPLYTKHKKQWVWWDWADFPGCTCWLTMPVITSSLKSIKHHINWLVSDIVTAYRTIQHLKCYQWISKHWPFTFVGFEHVNGLNMSMVKKSCLPIYLWLLWKYISDIHLLSISSSTAATQPRSLTSPGTPMNPGSSAQCPRTTSCKSGRWWIQLPSLTDFFFLGLW